MKKLLILAVVCSISFQLSGDKKKSCKTVDEGLVYCTFEASQKSIVGDSIITVLKIDPEKYEFTILCASEKGNSSLPADKWAEKYGLLGVINAGMYNIDMVSNVGYLKHFNHLNNPRVIKPYKSFVAFNPIKEGIPEFMIFDGDETEPKKIIAQYHSVIQNLRLIKRPGENRWSQQFKKWSEAALGIDKNGHALFIFSRSPYSMYDFNNMLLSLPINIVAAQHMEGGPQASLYLNHAKLKLSIIGKYNIGSSTSKNVPFLPIPNVIGFKKRK